MDDLHDLLRLVLVLGAVNFAAGIAWYVFEAIYIKNNWDVYRGDSADG